MSTLQSEDDHDQFNHGEVQQQTTVTLKQIPANNANNIADFTLPTKPFEGTLMK